MTGRATRELEQSLTCDEAKARWGEKIYSRRPSSVVTFVEIDDAGALWEPVFDDFFRWTGYRERKP
jgi:hypothetical protein